MKPSCKNCKYFIGNELIGSCYRFPEAFTKAPTDWCGEFKSKAEKKNKEDAPSVSKEDIDSAVRLYKNCFAAKFGADSYVGTADYAAAKKMILENGAEGACNYIRAFFADMPKWNLENRVFDLRVIPGIRNKLVLSAKTSGDYTMEEFLSSCPEGERHSRLWNEYADYVRKTGERIDMKEWLTVNG